MGAGLALRAAADPRIRDDVAFLHSFGGYFDAASVLSAVTTKQVVVRGKTETWVPDPLAASLFQHALLATIARTKRKRVRSYRLRLPVKARHLRISRGVESTLLALYENKDPRRTAEILAGDPDAGGLAAGHLSVSSLAGHRRRGSTSPTTTPTPFCPTASRCFWRQPRENIRPWCFAPLSSLRTSIRRMTPTN